MAMTGVALLETVRVVIDNDSIFISSISSSIFNRSSSCFAYKRSIAIIGRIRSLFLEALLRLEGLISVI